MTGYYRQFAFVSSVLAGFAFTFYGILLLAPKHRVGAWAAFMAVAASVAFLPVTLGMTFATARTATIEAAQGYAVTGTPSAALSMFFLGGVCLLFTSFGLSGWIHSRHLGIATVCLAVFGLVSAFFAMLPYLHVAR